MVMYSIRWSLQSTKDLKEIFEFIKNAESSERAKYVIAEIKKTAKEISHFPTKHAKEPSILDETVRYAIKWSYKIFFTINEEHVNIVRVFHTAQSPNKIV